jgi:tRNA threonylcarbamoyladenosine biosynthesis protein TsaE
VNSLALLSHSPLQTEELGRRLGTLLTPGTFVALHGGLGSGKTCLTRGIVAAAAPESAHLVASPTFAIMNGYPGRTPVYHFDFYRLADGHEIAELGFEEYLEGDGICIAEWSERLGDLMPHELLHVTLEYAGDDERTLTIEASGAGPEAILDEFAALLEHEKNL